MSDEIFDPEFSQTNPNVSPRLIFGLSVNNHSEREHCQGGDVLC